MWPTPQEYNEAIQEPHLCFEDKELASSQVQLNPLGLPRSITGAFASVYQLSSSDKIFAVRCFLEERTGLVERYQIIGSYLSENNPGAFIDFEFLERGIKVKGRWYPILKMQWCKGIPLDHYLSKHFKNHSRVEQLKENFLALSTRLAQTGIAHGDLQHGNILISDEKLFLVDYDGLFVPRLKGSESVELGHRNFQHPKRNNSHFDEGLDNFSSWIIYASLEALSVDSSLWNRFDCGDDCLIFRHRDFRDPEKSEVFSELAIHQSEIVRKVGASVSKLLRLKPEAIPPLSSDFDVIDKALADSTNLVTDSQFNLAIEADDLVDSFEKTPVPKKPKRNLVPKISMSRRLSTKLTRMKDNVQMHTVSWFAPDYWAQNTLQSGNFAYDNGNFGEAIKNYKQVAEIFRARSGANMWFFEANIRLGYSYLKTNQHGTASHYFREAEKYAINLEEDEFRLRATLLLASTYYESGQADRSYDLITRALKSTELFGVIIKAERAGAFENSLTIPNLLLNVGHIYLEREELETAIFCFETTIEFRNWIQDERKEKELKHLIRRALTGYCLAKFEEEKDETLTLFKRNMKSSSSLARLIESERDSRLANLERYAEFLRQVGQSFYEDKKFKNSKLAFTQSLKIHRKIASSDGANVFVADCLLGIGNTKEAVNALVDAFEKNLNLNINLVGKLDSVYEFHYATMIATIVSATGSFKDRNKCLNYIVKICPSGENLGLSLKYLYNSPLGKSKELAILLADCAKDLTRMGRPSCAQEIYSTSFKVFQRAGLVDQDADRVIECLLSNDDLDTAAQLLLESSNLERTVRAIVSATVKGSNFELEVITSILVKVLELQMKLPYEHVSDEEIKVSLSLLKWCAEDDDMRVMVMQDKCNIWQQRREMTLAHSMIDQGKYGTAISIFEGFEGKTGPNVIQAYELWSMRYFTLALENREHSRLALVDGYALGCAIEIISTLKDRGGLTPDFAYRVAELIARSSPQGMEQHLSVLLQIFSSSGKEFANARQKILSLMGAAQAPGTQSVLPPVAQSTEHVFDASPEPANQDLHDGNNASRFSPEPLVREVALATKSRQDEKLWKALHRALFLVDRERYGEAVKALTEFNDMDKENKFVVDANIALGYCQYLLSNNRLAKAHFSKAVQESINDRIESYYRASVCLTQFALAKDLSKSNIRTIIDPSSQKKDIYRVGASLIRKTIELDSDLAIGLADQLFSDAEEHEGLQHMTYAIDKYEAALTIYGIKNKKRQVEVVDCLDAIKQYSMAAKNLKLANMNRKVIDDDLHSLLTKLARRHVRTQDLEEVIGIYQDEGIDLATYILEVERDLIIQKLTRILTSAIPPERYLNQLYKDIEMLKAEGNLSKEFALKIATFMENNIEHCSKERKERLVAGLKDISVVIQFVSEEAALRIDRLMIEDEKED